MSSTAPGASHSIMAAQSAEDDLAGRLISAVCDGTSRSLEQLAQSLGTGPGQLAQTLELLKGEGLALNGAASPRIAVARAFVPLDALAIQDELQRLGQRLDVVVRTRMGSTNTALMNEARKDVIQRPLLLTTEMQTAGRGRQGRGWKSAVGASIAMSLAVPLSASVGDLVGLPLACGLAVSDALLRLGVPALLKWPNDCLIHGKKAAGILVEVQPLQRRVVAVVGVGVNVSAQPESVLADNALPVMDLESAGAGAPDRNAIIAALADCLLIRIEEFMRDGFSRQRGTWNERHAYANRPVQVHSSGEVLAEGVALGVDEGGRLLVHTDNGPVAILAGDVSVRPT